MKFKKGQRVIDEDGNFGTIIEADDKHNIYVRYDNGKGFGLYCVDPECPEHSGRLRTIKKDKQEKK